MANGVLAPPEGAPSVAAPVPVQRRALHIPNIPKFEIPEQWARPECLPLTPPPSPSPEEGEATSEEKSQHVRQDVAGEEDAILGKGGAVAGDGVVAMELEITNLFREGGGSSSGDAAAAKRGEDPAATAEAPAAEKEDPMEVVENGGNAEDQDKDAGAQQAEPSTSAAAAQTTTSEAPNALPSSSPGSVEKYDNDGAAEKEEAGQSQQRPSQPDGGAASWPGADTGKGKGKGKAKKFVDAMEEAEDDDDEDKDIEEGLEGPVRATRAKAEREKLLAQKEAEEAAAKAEREAAEQAAKEEKAAAKAKADADAAAILEASKKAAAEAREAERADRAAETAARRVRVNLMLRRLREDAEERQRLGQSYGPNDPRYYLGPNAGDLDADDDGEDPVVAVPRLTDRSGRDGDCNGTNTDADGDGKRRKTGGETYGGNSASGAATADAVQVATASKKESSGDWPPLGQRRLNRRLDQVRRFSALSQGPGPHQRLSLLQEPEKSPPQSGSGKVGGGRSSKAARGGTGGWLDAKLARMRRSEEGEWNAWKRRLQEEEGDKPREVAGPPLPFGFVPRLAHRALGAYALIRTFSRPFRITPCTSIAFLRAITLQLRNPLLDAVHCELLRRISCSLRGRVGGWWKGRDAQKELDWRYLDLVSMMS